MRSPFDVERRRALVGKPLAAPELSAPPPVPPVVDIQGVSYYSDAAKSVPDPELQEQNRAALAPLRAFVAAVVGDADRWMTSRPASLAHAERALAALEAWARAGALLGVVNRQGAYEREWTLGSLALAYLKVRAAPIAGSAAPATRATIEGWLGRVARAVRPQLEVPGQRNRLNNHAYWRGMGVAAAGIACDDEDLFDWGVNQARIGIEQVGADGILPLEMDRRGRALHYHVFALTPLVMLAEMAAANGLDLYREDNGAIRRLANRVIEGLQDPAPFAALTGVPQEIDLPPRKADLAWAEPYFARFADARLVSWLAAARPVADVRLGGDLTAAFGARLPGNDRL